MSAGTPIMTALLLRNAGHDTLLITSSHCELRPSIVQSCNKSLAVAMIESTFGQDVAHVRMTIANRVQDSRVKSSKYGCGEGK